MLRVLRFLYVLLNPKRAYFGGSTPAAHPLVARLLGLGDKRQPSAEDSGMTESQRAMRAEYLEERKALVESEQKYAENFDKIALTIISGALALSVAFVKDLAPHPEPWTLVFLICGWIVLVCGLLGSMLGLYWSQQAFKLQICIRDDQYRSDMGEEAQLDWKNPINDRVEKTNLFVIGAIVFGVAFVLSFAGVNSVLKALPPAPMKDSPKPISKTVEIKPGSSAPPAGRPVPITNTNPKPPPPSKGGKSK